MAEGEVIGLIEVMKNFHEVKATAAGTIARSSENEDAVMAGQPLAELDRGAMAGPGKLLVANRGEIAVRIIRAARELGLATVQVHSNADAALLAVRLADEATEIGPPQASKSYLKVEAILKAARATGATAHDHHRRCKRLTSPASQGPDHHRSEPL